MMIQKISNEILTPPKLDYTFYKLGANPTENDIVQEPNEIVICTRETFMYLVNTLNELNMLRIAPLKGVEEIVTEIQNKNKEIDDLEG